MKQIKIRTQQKKFKMGSMAEYKGVAIACAVLFWLYFATCLGFNIAGLHSVVSGNETLPVQWGHLELYLSFAVSIYSVLILVDSVVLYALCFSECDSEKYFPEENTCKFIVSYTAMIIIIIMMILFVVFTLGFIVWSFIWIVKYDDEKGLLSTRLSGAFITNVISASLSMLVPICICYGMIDKTPLNLR